MFQESGCYGRIDIGDMPADVAARLEALPGDWLEFDANVGAIVVRHVQPTSGSVLPSVASELVHLLAAIPYELQEQVPGGELLVHTENEGRLVRITVAPRGALHVEWAHPNYAGSQKRPYDGHEIQIESYDQRLNGRIAFDAPDGGEAAAAVQQLADTFEGLYPEGDFDAVGKGHAVEITMREVNLDVRLLIATMQRHAVPRSLSGRIAVASFREAAPEQMVRLVFEQGEIWVQRPLLWSNAGPAPVPSG